MNKRTARAKTAPPVKHKKGTPYLLNEDERDGMRAACRFNAELMDYIRPHVKPGVTTGAINDLVYNYTVSHGHTPACLGYGSPKSFPKSLCASVNEVVCHGIPGYRVLKEGDIVNIDLTSIVHGRLPTDTWHGDQSETFLVGEISDEARRLVQTCFECLWLGIAAARPFGRVIEIGHAIASHAYKLGFSVVEEYLGHGVGREFHEEPSIPHFPHQNFAHVILKPGMCFTIEPMINAGTKKTVLDTTDGWTVRTADGKLSAQFEHTILMTEEGPEILTLTKHGPQRGHRF